MPPSLDDRLRELAQATHDQLEPSPDLLRRITAATASRRPRRVVPRRVLVTAAVGIAAAVIAIGLVADSHIHGHVNTQVGGSRPTVTAPRVTQPNTARQDFINQMNTGCQQQQQHVQVVFPTPHAYAVAAGDLMPAAQQRLSGPYPPDAAPVVATVNADLADAQQQLQVAQARGNAGDLNAAKAAFDAANTDFTKASSALAAYGATACAPHQP
jgi:hypothetical protein